jgi:hypothetical protein
VLVDIDCNPEVFYNRSALCVFSFLEADKKGQRERERKRIFPHLLSEIWYHRNIFATASGLPDPQNIFHLLLFINHMVT